MKAKQKAAPKKKAAPKPKVTPLKKAVVVGALTAILPSEKGNSKMNKAVSLSTLTPNGIVNMPTPKKAQEKRFMSMFEIVALANYVQTEWRQFEGKTDVFFAHAASEKLGFPVSPNHITKTCAEFNITRKRGKISGRGVLIQDAAVRADLQIVVEELLKFANRHNFKSERLDALLDDFKNRSADTAEPDETE